VLQVVADQGGDIPSQAGLLDLPGGYSAEMGDTREEVEEVPHNPWDQ